MKFTSKLLIALRNILKNRRRSIVTVATIAIGFTALSIFEGYFNYVYRALEQEAIMGERIGHLTLTKKDYFEKGSTEPAEFSFNEAEVRRIYQQLSNIEGIQLISPRMDISGLISNGEASHIFISEAISVDDLSLFRSGEYAEMPGKLSANDNMAISLSEGLANKLGVTNTSYDLVLMTSTIDGMVNASDVSIAEIENTGSVGTNDKFALIPMPLGQSLYAFDGAHRLVILLEETTLTDSISQEIQNRISDLGMDIEVHNWKNLSVYYSQVKGLFDMMFFFISIVVIIVITSSVINTMGMAISERTREIGTLRSMGLRRNAVTKLFVLEGVLLVSLGCFVGIILTYIFGHTINIADIKYTPPDASDKANLIIDIVFSNLVGSVIVLTLLAGIASYFPARKASRLPITEALGHV